MFYLFHSYFFSLQINSIHVQMNGLDSNVFIYTFHVKRNLAKEQMDCVLPLSIYCTFLPLNTDVRVHKVAPKFGACERPSNIYEMAFSESPVFLPHAETNGYGLSMSLEYIRIA